MYQYRDCTTGQVWHIAGLVMAGATPDNPLNEQYVRAHGVLREPKHALRSLRSISDDGT
jgi:hypothetical protein